jgi:hypothetical protein
MSNKKLSFDEWLKILKEKDFDFYSVSKTEDLYVKTSQYRNLIVVKKEKFSNSYEKNFKEDCSSRRMTSGVQQKRRMIVGRKLRYKTNDPRVTLEALREQQGYLLLDFSHNKYLGKETLRVKIDGMDRRFYERYLFERKLNQKGK